MSLISLYLDRDNINYNLINSLKKHNIDFLQYNLKNDKAHMEAYNLTSLPSIRFKDTLINKITKESIKNIVNEFSNFVNNLPLINTFDKEISLKDFCICKKNPINTTSHKNFTNQILVNTLKITNKEKLIIDFKKFSKKYNKHK